MTMFESFTKIQQENRYFTKWMSCILAIFKGNNKLLVCVIQCWRLVWKKILKILKIFTLAIKQLMILYNSYWENFPNKNFQTLSKVTVKISFSSLSLPSLFIYYKICSSWRPMQSSATDCSINTMYTFPLPPTFKCNKILCIHRY